MFIEFCQAGFAQVYPYVVKLTRICHPGRITEPLSKEATLAWKEMMPDCTGMFVPFNCTKLAVKMLGKQSFVRH